MFWSSGPGIIYFQAGLFRNAMSRETVREKVLQWREAPVDVAVIAAKRWNRVPASRSSLAGARTCRYSLPWRL
jgi:hypothetical protein